MLRRIDFAMILFAVALAGGIALPAQAYLDPGTGSMILQMIVATVAGGLFLLKIYWSRVKAFVTGRPTDGSSAPEETPRDGNE
jgi:hypothetical protein